jgi:hypothetical protein
MKDVIGAIAAHLLHGEEAGSGLHDADYIYIYQYQYIDSLICPNASTRYRSIASNLAYYSSPT